MARRFTAAHYSNCADCEDVIEPGDDAGYVEDIDGAVCETCLDWHSDGDEFESYHR